MRNWLWLGVVSAALMMGSARGDQVITNITFGTGDNTGTGMTAKDAGVTINTNFFLVMGTISLSSNALWVLIGDRATWGSISNLQAQINGIVGGNTNAGISAETATNIADALDQAVTNWLGGLIAGKQGTNANLDGWSAVGTNGYVRLAQLVNATNVQTHVNFQYSQGVSYYVLLWDAETGHFAECPDLYVTDEGLLYTTGISGPGGGLTGLDASQLTTGYIPLARIVNVTSNQIAAATDAVYRDKGTNGLGTAAWAARTDFQPATANGTNWSLIDTNLMASKADLAHGTNHLNGSAIEAGTVSPERMGSNLVLVAGSSISLDTSYGSGVRTVTINGSSGSGYWTTETTTTTGGEVSTNLWTDTIAVDTTVAIDLELVAVLSTGDSWVHRWYGSFSRTNTPSGTSIQEDYNSAQVHGYPVASFDMQTPSDGVMRYSVNGGRAATYKWDLKLRKRVVSHP